MASLQQKYEAMMTDMVESFYQEVKETEKHRRRELNAATKLQTFFRMFTVRQLFKTKRQGDSELKKCIEQHQASVQGVQGTQRVQNKARPGLREETSSVFPRNGHCYSKVVRPLVIQFPRLLLSQIHPRLLIKKKIPPICLKEGKKLEQLQCEETRKMMSEHEKQLYIEDQKKREMTAKQEFKQLAGNLHHLCSTSAQPGVYNPPYVRQKPQAFNVDIETHLRDTFKTGYKWKPPSKKDIQFYKKVVRTETGNFKLQKVGQ